MKDYISLKYQQTHGHHIRVFFTLSQFFIGTKQVKFKISNHLQY